MRVKSRLDNLLAAGLIFGLLAGSVLHAATPAQLLIAAGDGQIAAAGTRLQGVVCVLVRDADNQPVSGVSVTWGTITGGGSLSGATEATDATGIATLGGWTLGAAAGVNTITATSAGLTPVTFTATATDPLPPQNVVIQWNNQLLLVFQNGNVLPTVSSRALGELQTSVFDAWAAYDAKALGTQLGATLRRPAAEQTDANKQIAISYAAYRTLADLFPAQKNQFNALMTQLNLDPGDMSSDPATPVGIGNMAAAANIAFRHSDGANQLGELNPGGAPYADYTGFVPLNDATTISDPDHWQPLPQGKGQQVFATPQWMNVKTFAIGDHSQRHRLTPKAPNRVTQKGYKTQALEILQYSAQLNDLTKTTAAYWVDKAGTVTPPGHWFKFAQYVSQRDNHSLDDDVKMFFILGNAELDCGVECWDIKFQFDSIRPVSAIHFLFKGQPVSAWAGPGLGTQNFSGELWNSYIPTPPFPEYVSGHSTFSAAGAETLKLFTKSSKFGFSVVIPVSFTSIELNVPAAPITFTWPNFVDAANDAGISRRYGGIHFKDGDMSGRKLGKSIAQLVWKKAQGYINGTLK